MKLSVLAKWVVEVPDGGRVLVKDGQKIEHGETIVKLNERTDVVDSSAVALVWRSGEKEDWLRKWVGKEITAGEELRSGGGFWKQRKPLLARENAVIKGIDEFGNLIYEIRGKEIGVDSPVDGVVKIPEKGKVVIEFRAVKIEGEGVGSDKSWGTIGGQKIVEKLSDVSAEFDGRVVLVSKLDQLLILKMEAVGVVGVVAKEIVEEIETDLPVLKVNNKDWIKLVEEFEKDKIYRCLLNATAGRLLVVESKSK
ncbi:MAG: hypothetical protein WCV93_03730 [Candidatus Shapirobacteria bacterium]|jgi:hypothetical protein